MDENLQTVPIIETPIDFTEREVICYPYLIVLLKVSMPRVLMKSRIVWTAVTVDLVKGVPLRANMFPETTKIDISPSALVPAMMGDEEAVKKARKLAVKWVMYKFHAFKTPKIDVVKEQKAYKAFFFTETDGKEILIDSVKGITGEDL